jgi:hypothetical protein
MASENVQGWGRVGVIGALLHDHGRWAEERIFGYPGASLIHARLSFLLGRELFADLPMPALIRQHILAAAVRHTAGGDGVDPMPLKLTVTADRDQLYGPEMVVRLTHHTVDRDGSVGSFYGEKGGLSILERLEFFLIRRIPGPLFARDTYQEVLRRMTATFLLLAYSQAEARTVFDRVFQGHANTPAYPVFNVEETWEQVQAEVQSTVSATQALRQLLSAPNLAPAAHYMHLAVDKLSALPQEREPFLAKALVFADQQRILEDVRQYRALKAIQAANTSDSMVTALTDRLLQGWTGRS